jgi:hypothetical protein
MKYFDPLSRERTGMRKDQLMYFYAISAFFRGQIALVRSDHRWPFAALVNLALKLRSGIRHFECNPGNLAARDREERIDKTPR